MPPKSARDDNLLFVYALIKNSSFNTSSVDWDVLTKDLGKTKGSLQTRWWRLQKTLDDAAPGAAAPSTPAPAALKTKKRKAAAIVTDDDGTSDVDTPSKKKVAKGEVKSEVVVKVKSEPKDEDEEGVEGLAGEGMGGEVAV